ncbi:dTDP-4-dehydrorhamnose 3,5-epimerase [Bosea sp. BIWAKO-01]|nr:dTDP-4-dehydrorhamnose 3,5-epimerase [Bosea sp. BIWAKO-01]
MFVAFEAGTEVAYKVDAPYAPQGEGGLFWADPALAINWPVVSGATTLSEKDAKLPGFADFASPFVYEGA